jgi:hypothetical protein
MRNSERNLLNNNRREGRKVTQQWVAVITLWELLLTRKVWRASAPSPWIATGRKFGHDVCKHSTHSMYKQRKKERKKRKRRIILCVEELTALLLMIINSK